MSETSSSAVTTILWILGSLPSIYFAYMVLKFIWLSLQKNRDDEL